MPARRSTVDQCRSISQAMFEFSDVATDDGFNGRLKRCGRRIRPRSFVAERIEGIPGVEVMSLRNDGSRIKAFSGDVTTNVQVVTQERRQLVSVACHDRTISSLTDGSRELISTVYQNAAR